MTKQRLLFFVFFLFYLAIIAKLFYLQVLNPSPLTDTTYLKTNKILPERGKIYDRNGEPLAVNKSSYLLYIEPKKMQDKNYTVKKLDEILQIGEATLEAKIDETKDWVSIKDGIGRDQKQKLMALGLKGLGFEDKFQRYYPESSLAAHLLGFVGKNTQGEGVGYFGIEGFYNKDLVGLPGIVKSDRDILGKPILIGTQQKLDSENGRDLYLNIDASIQEVIKRKLQNGLETYGAKEGCIIVVNPNILEILALSCLPDFAVENYYKFSEDFFKNPAISNLYEPGSTFKPFIMAAALEEKSIRPDDFYEEKGPVEIGGYTIKTWNDKYEGKISVTRILEKSSNVGIVHISQLLGNKKLYDYLRSYGFGSSTGIDLQGEASGYLKPQSEWYPVDFATVSFGQGIAVTPIQMIRAFSALINGGALLKPLVVQRIDSLGEEKRIKTSLEKRVISNQTSEIIKKMLTATVENGEVRWAKPKGYQIAGKTGTAQIPIKGHYDPTKTVASFIGFAPVNEPKFLALVILHEPKTSPWGSETAAPLFFEVAKELLVYYNIAPD
ncbi:penicillin-binding protein 2 [Candidatus Roizmanbacteria bacterium]|nr:penicillin-binding protein 2 [Candidatus Roizmanbacteria bacterium]